MFGRFVVLAVASCLAAGCFDPYRPTPVEPSRLPPQTAAPEPPVASAPPAPEQNPTTTGQPNGGGPASGNGVRLEMGRSTEGSVQRTDPVCFPNWDAHGHCRQFDVTVEADGTLMAIVEWTGPSRGYYDSEMFLVAPDGSWEYAPETWPERRVSRPVKSGLIYNIVLLSYGPFPDAFKLRNEFR